MGPEIYPSHIHLEIICAGKNTGNRLAVEKEKEMRKENVGRITIGVAKITSIDYALLLMSSFPFHLEDFRQMTELEVLQVPQRGSDIERLACCALDLICDCAGSIKSVWQVHRMTVIVQL
jgi:hypothetical protein